MYTFKCPNCHLKTENKQYEPQPCPNCNTTLKRTITNINIAFKGSGFYKTDTR
jgi:putative FmdB family regulatory protein